MIDKILQGRYKIQRQLRKQAGRQTLLAQDLKTRELVGNRSLPPPQAIASNSTNLSRVHRF